eukprot:CAMPEP_0172313538 /NCGR_PEP_ID=MMETSP1058-20130122/20401_1 /TAXON_ID=83371 /ORGANISM="Detonula confervacea, Strain CCMP 353" /LENGTH=60 /DNA_ID=CAMNT_0013027199 /DNA_START=39 /DNA_END=218 /DNA_ORIENTATION=+
MSRPITAATATITAAATSHLLELMISLLIRSNGILMTMHSPMGISRNLKRKHGNGLHLVI